MTFWNNGKAHSTSLVLLVEAYDDGSFRIIVAGSTIHSGRAKLETLEAAKEAAEEWAYRNLRLEGN